MKGSSRGSRNKNEDTRFEVQRDCYSGSTENIRSGYGEHRSDCGATMEQLMDNY